jgi:hypothetical protein
MLQSFIITKYTFNLSAKLSALSKPDDTSSLSAISTSSPQVPQIEISMKNSIFRNSAQGGNATEHYQQYSYLCYRSNLHRAVHN